MAAARVKANAPQGIRARHARTCRSRVDERCNCRPSWEAFVYLKREGRKVRKTFATQAAAKQWRTDALHAANRGRLRGPSAQTVAQAAAELLAGMENGSIPARGGRRYSPATVRGYRRGLELRILPTLGHEKLSALARADVQALADRMTAEGLAASTVQNTLDPLRVIYRRALRRDVVAVDPTEGLELRTPDGRRERIASPEEAAALLAALTVEERALWATALYAGLRRGELRALRWSDVDLAGRRVRVERSWDDCDGERDGPKSDAGRRSVPILALLAPDLVEHGLRTRRGGDDLVFGLTAEQAFYPATVRRRALAAWEAENARAAAQAQERAEDPPSPLVPISLHEARHTFASLLIRSGADAKAIQTVMGHATIAMTFDVYGKLMPDSLDAAAAAADAYLGAAGRR